MIDQLYSNATVLNGQWCRSHHPLVAFRRQLVTVKTVVMTAVTSVDLVVCAELMVDFQVKLPGRKACEHNLAKVRIRKYSVRYVGFRIQIQNCLSNRVAFAFRDDVARQMAYARQELGYKRSDRRSLNRT